MGDKRNIRIGGDRMSVWKTKRLIGNYRKMAGLPYKEIPKEIIELEASIAEIKREIMSLRRRSAPEAELGLRLSSLSDLEYRFRQILITAKLVD